MDLTPRYLAVVSLYVATGILRPMLVDSLRLSGCLGWRWLLVPTLANTVGMALCGVLSNPNERSRFRRRLFSTRDGKGEDGGQGAGCGDFGRAVLSTAAMDLMGGMLLTTGISLTGGSVFVVLYNSCPAWTAILSRYLMGRKLSALQTAGVALVCAGLIANVAASHLQLAAPALSTSSSSPSSPLDIGGAGLTDRTVLIGSAVVLMGCVLHSAFFVMSEMVLRRHEGDGNDGSLKRGGGDAAVAVPPPLWSCCLGTIESAFMLLWVLGGAAMHGLRADSPGGSELASSGTTCSAPNFVRGFLSLVAVDGTHAATFFLLLSRIGSVGSALLKGVQSVSVMALSAVFFCGREAAQCPTPGKMGSAAIVLAGTMFYAVGSRTTKPKAKPKGPEEIEMESLLS